MEAPLYIAQYKNIWMLKSLGPDQIWFDLEM